MILDKYNRRVDAVNSLLCIGLDSDFEKLPAEFKQKQFPQFEFNNWIIDQTSEFAAAFKPNIAFYEARGEAGIHELKMTMDYLREQCPDIVTICDCKRADIGNTNQGYVTSLFDWFGFDAVTLHPYVGKEALKPFLDRADKACIILCRTSNPGAGELQDLIMGDKPLWQIVAEKVSNEWNDNRNCMLVVGATYPEEMKTIRAVVGDMTLLVPGVGAQGGDVRSAVASGINAAGKGIMISSSRDIIFSGDPRAAALKLRDQINDVRKL